ncbi:hypothetical protein AB852_01925 [Streptomyces uncialis]|uniref:Pycsar effector protein domain-containing protein n=2 Tax=Streptomyces uncialis TaxID=1048205 RepID=A0A1Q4VFN3_9ACTN|nr:hypothetical protein AB852_01925 [Streptomyces uncialis]
MLAALQSTHQQADTKTGILAAAQVALVGTCDLWTGTAAGAWRDGGAAGALAGLLLFLFAAGLLGGAGALGAALRPRLLRPRGVNRYSFAYLAAGAGTGAGGGGTSRVARTSLAARMARAARTASDACTASVASGAPGSAADAVAAPGSGSVAAPAGSPDGSGDAAGGGTGDAAPDAVPDHDPAADRRELAQTLAFLARVAVVKYRCLSGAVVCTAVMGAAAGLGIVLRPLLG